MGDVSAEPSMEEILSSIKRIIAEEGDAPPRGRRGQRPAPPPPADPADDEVLELRDAIPDGADADADAGPVAATDDRDVYEPAAYDPAPPEPRIAMTQPAPRPAAPSAAEPLLSPRTTEASRSALDSLSRLMVRPEPGSDGSLEGLVREMLRPMLREWLDLHLPAMVESMVESEIARITGQR